jgi:hypothetical protein
MGSLIRRQVNEQGQIRAHRPQVVDPSIHRRPDAAGPAERAGQLIGRQGERPAVLAFDDMGEAVATSPAENAVPGCMGESAALCSAWAARSRMSRRSRAVAGLARRLSSVWPTSFQRAWSLGSDRSGESLEPENHTCLPWASLSPTRPIR